MGGSPGNTIEQRAPAPAGRHTYFLCLGTQNSIPPGSHAGAFGPRVPSLTQTARVSRPTGLRIFVALLSLPPWANSFRPAGAVACVLLSDSRPLSATMAPSPPVSEGLGALHESCGNSK